MVSIIPESDLGAVHSPRLPRVVPHPCSSAIVFLYSYTGWLLSSVSTDAFGSHSASMKQKILTLMNGTACLAHHWYRIRRHSSVGSTMGDRLRQRQQCGRSRPRRSCSCRWLRQVPHGPVGPIHPKRLCTEKYTLSSSFKAIHASFACVPRYVFAIISTTVCVSSRHNLQCTTSDYVIYRLIPVAIVGSTRFYATFVSILNAVEYWTAVFAEIVMAEHLFRKNDWTQYDLSQWCKPKGLPAGAAASFTMVCACDIIVPCMSQSWYVGPIASAGTGDIVVLVGFAAACIIYPALRAVERGVLGR